MIRAWVIALLLLASTCAAQVVGVAYYAMPAFTKAQCNLALSVFRGVEVPALSTLWDSFGDDRSCLRSFVAAGSGDGKRVVYIHPVNNTCKHKPRYCTRWDMPPFRPRLREIAAFIRENNRVGVKWMVSLGLEDDYTKAQAQRRLRIAREELPAWVAIVRNTDAGADISGVDFREHHGMLDAKRCKPAGACLYSNDGDPIDSWPALQQRYASMRSRARYLFLWTRDPQRHCRLSDKWVEPRGRCLRFVSDDFRKLNVILRRLN